MCETNIYDALVDICFPLAEKLSQAVRLQGGLETLSRANNTVPHITIDLDIESKNAQHVFRFKRPSLARCVVWLV